MSGRLTTHVLDTALGRPAAGVRVDLHSVDGGGRRHLKTVVTNADGRVDAPLLEGDALEPGTYELGFHAAEYHATTAPASAAPPFLDVVPIRFTVADAAAHYHVPLLLTPWGYTTYRGS